MRRQALSQALAEFTLFIARYPFFSFFVFASVVLMLVTMALFFGGLSHKWEKRFAKMLAFCIIPVCAGLVYYYYPVFPPLLATVLLWSLFPAVFIFKTIRSFIQKKIKIKNAKGWVCANCRQINEAVFLVCKQCNMPPKRKN